MTNFDFFEVEQSDKESLLDYSIDEMNSSYRNINPELYSSINGIRVCVPSHWYAEYTPEILNNILDEGVMSHPIEANVSIFMELMQQFKDVVKHFKSVEDFLKIVLVGDKFESGYLETIPNIYFRSLAALYLNMVSIFINIDTMERIVDGDILLNDSSHFLFHEIDRENYIVVPSEIIEGDSDVNKSKSALVDLGGMSKSDLLSHFTFDHCDVDIIELIFPYGEEILDVLDFGDVEGFIKFTARMMEVYEEWLAL